MKYLLLFSAVLSLIFSCKNENHSAIANPKEIKIIEDSLLRSPIGTNYKSKAPVLITMMAEYANHNPKDTLAPVYLFKAGDLSRGLGKFEDAIQYWALLYKEYPEYKRAPDALFLEAFTYENEIKDLPKAKALYEEFLKKYPTHDFAANIPVLLENLGKTPEELIESFKKKNAK
jgi:tetratricopeptide (TPR) repeat protein